MSDAIEQVEAERFGFLDAAKADDVNRLLNQGVWHLIDHPIHGGIEAKISAHNGTWMTDRAAALHDDLERSLKDVMIDGDLPLGVRLYESVKVAGWSVRWFRKPGDTSEGDQPGDYEACQEYVMEHWCNLPRPTKDSVQAAAAASKEGGFREQVKGHDPMMVKLINEAQAKSRKESQQVAAKKGQYICMP